MDEQMIARALAECAERNGFAEAVPLGGYSMLARAAHSVMAGKVAELEADKARLDFLQSESDDLRCFEIPTGGGDADVGWRVIGHYMAEPCERIIGEVWHDDLREAIDMARAAFKQNGAYSDKFAALAPYPERRSE